MPEWSSQPPQAHFTPTFPEIEAGFSRNLSYCQGKIQSERGVDMGGLVAVGSDGHEISIKILHGRIS